MFDKLQALFNPPEEREFKPREQGLREKQPKIESAPTAQVTMSELQDNKYGGKGVLIGEDPFKGKLDEAKNERIQSKLKLLRQLQKELGEHE